MSRQTFFGVGLAVILAVASLSAFAQRGGGRGAAAGQTVEKIKMLKPNLYEITGGGANILVRVTNQGLIVVDTKNPGDENFNRVMEEIKSVTNQPVKFEQDEFHVRLTGLPKIAPHLVTTFALECDGEPKQDNEGKRATRPREGIYKVV